MTQPTSQIVMPQLSWNNGNYGNTNVSNNGNVWGGVGNALFGLNRVTTGPNTQYTANELSNALYQGYNSDLLSKGHTYAMNNLNTNLKNMTGGNYTANLKDGKISLADSYGNVVDGNSVIGGSDGTSLDWNFGQMMGGITNLANMGLGIASGVMSWDQYKQNKDLLNKNKQLLEQQIEQNKRDMADTKAERERRDRIRSNAQAQRASSSAVSSF
jgi:hypothetical protein